VVKTLIEAVILVFLVMLVFLQNFRATIIPTLVIPVALLGTFWGLSVIGFTINQLTMFALVLAIGIVVDDAIVVIENVERIMAEEKLPPREATIKAMGQITGAVIAITVVLAAVFIPSALQGGASGEIYKQFALTIAISMAFSAFLALGFTPALCATFLKQHEHDSHEKKNVIFRTFEKYYGKLEKTYVGHIGAAIKHAPRWMIVFALLTVLAGFLFTRLPSSFVPEEDQGYALAIVQLPPGNSLQKTKQVFNQVRGTLQQMDGFDGVMEVAGFSFLGRGENVGMAFIRLKPWDERDITVPEFIQQANQRFYGIKGAQIFVVNLPTIQGLGQFGGFDMWLQDRAGLGEQALMAARNQLLGAAAQDPSLMAVRPNTLENAPQLQLHVDRVQAQAMGMSLSDIYNGIQLMLAPVYVNDFFYEGRIKRVNMRADAPYRTGAESLARIYSPSSQQTDASGGRAMIPLSNVVQSSWASVPPSLSRYNGYSAVNINGSAAPGSSSGQAMTTMENIVTDQLPQGFGYDWSGMSYQEILAGNSATLLMVLSIVVVFLCLAALYESWSIPVAVLLVVPLGALGALAFTMLRGLSNDLFFKIGLITIIGLAAKNAILIVEFAVMERKQGKTLREAVISASHLRFRPILMTSFAFIMGVLPMAISTGAGANARHAIGTGVIGGMFFATFLGLLLIPVFFVSVRRMLGDRMDEPSKEYLEEQGKPASR
jgi:multidrug efflux pump